MSAGERTGKRVNDEDGFCESWRAPACLVVASVLGWNWVGTSGPKSRREREREEEMGVVVLVLVGRWERARG